MKTEMDSKSHNSQNQVIGNTSSDITCILIDKVNVLKKVFRVMLTRKPCFRK